MAMTINSAVCGSRRSWAMRASTFILGTFVGATTTFLLAFALLSTANALSAPTGSLILIGFGLVTIGVFKDLGIDVPVPYRRSQVPEYFRDTFPPISVAFVFGWMLGVGFLTLFTFGAHLAMIATVPLVATFTGALACAVAFSAGKGIVMFTGFGVSSSSDVTRRMAWTFTRLRALRVVSIFASATFAILLATEGR